MGVIISIPQVRKQAVIAVKDEATPKVAQMAHVGGHPGGHTGRHTGVPGKADFTLVGPTPEAPPHHNAGFLERASNQITNLMNSPSPPGPSPSPSSINDGRIKCHMNKSTSTSGKSM